MTRKVKILFQGRQVATYPAKHFSCASVYSKWSRVLGIKYMQYVRSRGICYCDPEPCVIHVQTQN